MKHRHIHTDHLEDSELGSIATIDSVLERGGPPELRRLYLTVWHDPWGEVAERALWACEGISAYGEREKARCRRLIAARRRRVALPPDASTAFPNLGPTHRWRTFIAQRRRDTSDPNR